MADPLVKEAIEKIRVATYEHPMAHSASEWEDRLEGVLEWFASETLADRPPARRAKSVVMCPHGFTDRSKCTWCHWSP